jgi:hypothetical protein
VITLMQVFQSLGPDEYMVVDRNERLVMTFDEKAFEEFGEHRNQRTFKILPDDTLEEVDLETVREEIIQAVQDKVDVRGFLAEALATNSPRETLDIHERLKKAENRAGVRSSPGCFSLKIPDATPGKETIELVLRGH